MRAVELKASQIPIKASDAIEEFDRLLDNYEKVNERLNQLRDSDIEQIITSLRQRQVLIEHEPLPELYHVLTKFLTLRDNYLATYTHSLRNASLLTLKVVLNQDISLTQQIDQCRSEMQPFHDALDHIST